MTTQSRHPGQCVKADAGCTSASAACPPPVRCTLLAALCWTREAELVDGLVELLIGLIHWINARAERRVEKELIGQFAAVPGKRGIFPKMVNAALDKLDETVQQVVFPQCRAGRTRALAKELMATERVVAKRIRYQLLGSYLHYYRRMLAPRLDALEFKCHNTAYRPVLDAIELLARYAGVDSEHLLQPSLMFINTQLLQAVLRDPQWAGKLTEEDRRALSSLF